MNPFLTASNADAATPLAASITPDNPVALPNSDNEEDIDPNPPIPVCDNPAAKLPELIALVTALPADPNALAAPPVNAAAAPPAPPANAFAAAPAAPAAPAAALVNAPAGLLAAL